MLRLFAPQEAKFCYLSKESVSNRSEIIKRVTEALGVAKQNLKQEKMSQTSCDFENVLFKFFYIRGVAQPGRALALGARCRVFKSCRPDQ